MAGAYDMFTLSGGEETPSLEQVETSYNQIGKLIKDFQKKNECSFSDAIEVFEIAYYRESSSIKAKRIRDDLKNMEEGGDQDCGGSFGAKDTFDDSPF